MPEAVANGVAFTLAVSTDNGVTNIVIAGAKDATISRKAAKIDATTKASAGDEESIAGLRSWTVAGTGLWVSSDAGQEMLNVAHETGTLLTIKLVEGDSGVYLEGKVVIVSLSMKAGNEAAVTYDFSFDGTGPLARVGGAH